MIEKQYRVIFPSTMAVYNTITELRIWCREQFGSPAESTWMDNFVYNSATFTNVEDAETFRKYIDQVEILKILSA